MTGTDNVTENQHMIQRHMTPLKQWINDADCSTLATLNVHNNYIANSNNAKLMTWYCGDNKSGTILLTNKKMHTKGIIGEKNEIVTILIDSGASHSCVSGG